MKPETKIKILIRIGSLNGGGAEKSLIALLKYFDYSKYEVDLLLNHKIGVYLDQLPKEVKLFSITKEPYFLVFNLLKKVYRKLFYIFYEFFPYLLYKYKLKEKKYDLEIGFLPCILTSLIKSPLKSKKIGWVHSDLRAAYYYKNHKSMLSALQKMDLIATVSQQCKDVLLSLSPDLKNKTKVIYNIIDADEVIEKSQREVPKIKTSTLQLICIGRLSIVQKRFDRLIRVCHKLKQEDIDFHLWILGEGPDKQKLEEQIKTLHLENTIELLGYKKNPYPYLRSSDVFVLPSLYEGMSYVVLEALVLNKPVVSTDVTGPRELLEDGKYGLLVENSQEGIYKGLKKMITDKELRESFTKIKKDFSPFDPKNIALQVEKVIEKLIINP